MADFTPTVEQLRLAYWHYVYEHSAKPGRDADAEFNRGMAAHDAEVRASVVPEEPEVEWEYAEKAFDGLMDGWIAVRRRKAGPWLPASPLEGQTDA